MNRAKVWVGMVVCVIVLVSSGLADVPRLINYQGRLTDSNGTAVDTTTDLTIVVFSDEAGLTPLWGETHPGTLISAGLFNVILGSINPIPDSVFNGQLRRIGLQLDSGPVSDPLSAVVSTAYAIRAAHADTALYALDAPGAESRWTLNGVVLYSSDAWGLARGSAGNELLGTSTDRTVNFGTECTTGVSGQPIPYTTIAGGHANRASEFGSTVSGGVLNGADGTSSSVSGGEKNLAAGEFSAVGGGNYDTAGGDFSKVGGGQFNSAHGSYATVGGGLYNQAIGSFSTVAGGGPVDSMNPYTTRNRAYDSYATISGGGGNLAGIDDAITDNQPFATVGGGQNNIAAGEFATTGGGSNNTTEAYAATVAGGQGNVASGNYAGVAAGSGNVASGTSSNVGGGSFNIADQSYSTIGGGRQNRATGSYSTVFGGYGNVVAGAFSSIPGGYADTIEATATHSCLFGIGSKLTQDSTFMVDMPRIRFGDESTGYEFPAADGASGQVMTTDGAGQLAWSTLGGNSGWVDDGTTVRLGSSSDSVGIGTASPQKNLHVVNSGTTSATVRVQTTDIGSAILELQSTDAGIAEVRKYASGELAIQTHSPSKLSLITDPGGSLAFRVGAGNGIWMDSSGHVSIGIASGKNRLDVRGGAVIGIGFAGAYEGPTNGLAVDGNVGIGLVSPNRKLYVTETVNGLSYPLKVDNPHSTLTTTGTGILFSVGGGGSNNLDIDRGKGALVYTNDNSWNRGAFHFLQNSAADAGNPMLADAVMSIKNNGRVGIGTTDPQDALEVKGVIRIDNGTGGSGNLRYSEGGVLRWALLYRPWASDKIGFWDEQGARWTLALEQGTGEVGIGTDSPNYTLDVRGTIGNNTTLHHSDRRWKRNIRPLHGSLDAVSRLQGVSYEWRRDEFTDMQFPDGRHIGLIAQEVEAVAPELVHTDENGFKSLEYAKLTALLVEAVKDLKQENERLQAQVDRIDELQAQIDELRRVVADSNTQARVSR